MIAGKTHFNPFRTVPLKSATLFALTLTFLCGAAPALVNDFIRIGQEE